MSPGQSWVCESNEARTPVTVLSGALGAGKTTLLRPLGTHQSNPILDGCARYILEKDHGYRIAVIQNEHLCQGHVRVVRRGKGCMSGRCTCAKVF